MVNFVVACATKDTAAIARCEEFVRVATGYRIRLSEVLIGNFVGCQPARQYSTAKSPNFRTLDEVLNKLDAVDTKRVFGIREEPVANDRLAQRLRNI
ncbi:hypothetical protein [Erythrobacter colymbi]|uniref:hypothetical protein n=1 Tax=Erythrobacter colymbi TaxID=1161202 RepID=UPI0013906A6F|nr:hypothetical protein [Erythrobacter colymbi]